MVRSNKNKLFIGALALLIGFAQPMEALSFESVRTWAASVWQELSITKKVLFSVGALTGIVYMAHRLGAKTWRNTLDQERARNQYLHQNFMRGRLRGQNPIAIRLPRMLTREVSGHIEDIAQGHLRTIWPVLTHRARRWLPQGIGSHQQNSNYFKYHVLTAKPGLARIPDTEPAQFTVDWSRVYEYVNHKLYDLKRSFDPVRLPEGHERPCTIAESIKLWSIHNDNEHNLYQLPVLEQGRWSVPADNFYYEMSQRDGANCGYHALKNAHFILELLRLPDRNKRSFIRQLTTQDYYMPRLHQWRTQIILAPHRANPEQLDWLELGDLQRLIDQEISLGAHVTVIPRMNQNGQLTFAEGNAGWVQNQNILLQDWPAIQGIRDELRLIDDFRHAFILHVNGNHWITLVVHKTTIRHEEENVDDEVYVNFYVTNSMRNNRSMYNLREVRQIIDFLAAPEAQPEAENNAQNANQEADPEADPVGKTAKKTKTK